METAINAESDLSDFIALLSQTTTEDYSGYTNFDSLSADIKIKWLDEAARFFNDIFKG